MKVGGLRAAAEKKALCRGRRGSGNGEQVGEGTSRTGVRTWGEDGEGTERGWVREAGKVRQDIRDGKGRVGRAWGEWAGKSGEKTEMSAKSGSEWKLVGESGEEW